MTSVLLQNFNQRTRFFVFKVAAYIYFSNKLAIPNPACLFWLWSDFMSGLDMCSRKNTYRERVCVPAFTAVTHCRLPVSWATGTPRSCPQPTSPRSEGCALWLRPGTSCSGLRSETIKFAFNPCGVFIFFHIRVLKPHESGRIR